MKPVRPTQLVQIFPARLLRTEAVVEFKQRLRIVLVHSQILHIVATGVNRIPQSNFIKPPTPLVRT